MMKYEEIMKKRFWFLGANSDDTKNILVDTHTWLLWQLVATKTKLPHSVRLADYWALPSFNELGEFARQNHPWQQGEAYSILNISDWLCDVGVIDLRTLCSTAEQKGYMIAVNKQLQRVDHLEREHLLNNAHDDLRGG